MSGRSELPEADETPDLEWLAEQERRCKRDQHLASLTPAKRAERKEVEREAQELADAERRYEYGDEDEA